MAVEQRKVADRVELLGDRPRVLLAGNPQLRIDAPQVERHGIFAQRLVIAPVVIFVKVRHREFAQAAVDRVAPAQADTVGLGDRTPEAASPEERYYMVEVAHRALLVRRTARTGRQVSPPTSKFCFKP